MVDSRRNLSGIRGIIRALFVAMGFVVLSIMLAQPLLAQAAGGSIWSIVNSPNPSTTPSSDDSLSGVTALSDTNAWAVGSFSNTTTQQNPATLIEHWDGTTWSIVPSPNSSTAGSTLDAVSADGPNDIWAVGSNSSLTGGSTLTEHWDGTSWSVVPSPTPGFAQLGVSLTGVAALSSTNAWAIGWFNAADQRFFPLIMHWDGTAWTIVPNLPLKAATILNAVSAVSATDIWAVGELDQSNGFASVAYHFDGTSWSISPSSVFHSARLQSLNGVAAISSNDVWAMGTSSTTRAFALHWNGTAWSQVATPKVGNSPAQFFSVAAINSSDVWAVGKSSTSGGLAQNTLIEHWNGTKWSVIATPNNGNSSNILQSVAVSSTTSLWSVGTFQITQQNFLHTRTLTLHTTQG